MRGTAFLVSYGASGNFGMFMSNEPLTCQRGERVVVRTDRGLELGLVLYTIQEAQAHWAEEEGVGQLLRRASPDDEALAITCSHLADRAFLTVRQLLADQQFSLEIIDVEALLEPRVLVLHYLGSLDGFQPLRETLSRQYDAQIELFDLAVSAPLGDCPARSMSAGCPASSACGSGCGSCGGCPLAAAGASAPSTATLCSTLRLNANRQVL